MTNAYRFDQSTRNEKEQSYAQEMERFIKDCGYSQYEKAENWPLFCSRQMLAKYLCKTELFKKVLPVHGSIVEAGVLFGGSLMLWAQLSATCEPSNYQRKILGFDTFSGVPELTKNDFGHEEAKPGGFEVNSLPMLEKSIELYDKNRPIGHIPKVELIKGNATVTIPKYIESNPHLIVSLLFLDFDVYAPTKTALECFLPRMSKGSIVVFDELNLKRWPGETIATLETINITELKLQRFSYCPNISYAIIGD